MWATEVLLDFAGGLPVISEIGPRRNLFERPPVANVEQFVRRQLPFKVPRRILQ